jgi:hypothetical protein
MLISAFRSFTQLRSAGTEKALIGYSTRLHDSVNIPPLRGFLIVLFLLSTYFHNGELYYSSIPFMLKMMQQHRSRYEKVDIVNKQRK